MMSSLLNFFGLFRMSGMRLSSSSRSSAEEELGRFGVLASSAGGGQPPGRPIEGIGFASGRHLSNRLGLLAGELDNARVDRVVDVEHDVDGEIAIELDVNGCMFGAGDFGGVVGAFGDKVFDG